MLGRMKRLVVMPLLVAVLMIGSFSAVAMADDGPENGFGATFLEMVADSLGVSTEDLQDAFSQARSEMSPEDRDPEEFQALVEQILVDDYGYDIDPGDLQDAIDEAKAELKEQMEGRRAELQEKYQERWNEFREWMEDQQGEMLERFRERLEGLRGRLGDRWPEFEQQFRERDDHGDWFHSRWAGRSETRNGSSN